MSFFHPCLVSNTYVIMHILYLLHLYIIALYFLHSTGYIFCLPLIRTLKEHCFILMIFDYSISNFSSVWNIWYISESFLYNMIKPLISDDDIFTRHGQRFIQYWTREQSNISISLPCEMQILTRRTKGAGACSDFKFRSLKAQLI